MGIDCHPPLRVKRQIQDGTGCRFTWKGGLPVSDANGCPLDPPGRSIVRSSLSG